MICPSLLSEKWADKNSCHRLCWILNAQFDCQTFKYQIPQLPWEVLHLVQMLVCPQTTENKRGKQMQMAFNTDVSQLLIISCLFSNPRHGSWDSPSPLTLFTNCRPTRIPNPTQAHYKIPLFKVYNQPIRRIQSLNIPVLINHWWIYFRYQTRPG